MNTQNISLAETIVAYEDGTLSRDETLKLFSHLIKTGVAWILQGTYGRTANNLIKEGHISKEGEILWL